MATVESARELEQNNRYTANFGALLVHLLSLLKRMADGGFTGDVPVEAYNALFLTRAFTKHFVEDLSAGEIHDLFESTGSQVSPVSHASQTSPTSPPLMVQVGERKLCIEESVLMDTRDRAEQLLELLIGLLLEMNPKTQDQHGMYVETLNTVVVLLSTQIFQSSTKHTGENYFLNIWMETFSHLSDPLVQRLISNFSDQKPAPGFGIGGLAYSAYTYLFPGTASGSTGGSAPEVTSLADRSILVLLLLANQPVPVTPLTGDEGSMDRNSVRLAVGRVGDGRKDATSLDSLQSSALQSTSNDAHGSEHPVSFRDLYETI